MFMMIILSFISSRLYISISWGSVSRNSLCSFAWYIFLSFFHCLWFLILDNTVAFLILLVLVLHEIRPKLAVPVRDSEQPFKTSCQFKLSYCSQWPPRHLVLGFISPPRHDRIQKLRKLPEKSAYWTHNVVSSLGESGDWVSFCLSWGVWCGMR